MIHLNKRVQLNITVVGGLIDILNWPLEVLSKLIASAERNRDGWKKNSKQASKDFHLDSEGYVMFFSFVYYALLVIWYVYYMTLLGVTKVIGYIRSLFVI